MLNIRRLILAFAAIISITTARAQQGAQISSDELTYNFGIVAEADGFASRTFTIKNTGDVPSVITRVTAPRGCTRPEWTESPIASGKTGEVKTAYNLKGRPGPFYKIVSIFSNGKKGSYSLAIKGNVIPKPSQPILTYPCSVDDLKLHTKTVLSSSIHPEETLGGKINIKNKGKTSTMTYLSKVSHYLNVQVNPATFQPDEVGAIVILTDARVLERRGQASTLLPIMIQSVGKKEVSGEVQISANVADNFSKLSTANKARTPIAELFGILLEFGKLPNKKSIAPLIGSKVSGMFEITNAGKTPFTIYSVTCDGECVDLSGGKKEPRPGAAATFKVTLWPKEIKTKSEAPINVVCNDPDGPIRLIKVMAYK